MAVVASTPLISRISEHRPTSFDIFSRASRLELVDLTCSTQLLSMIGKPEIILTELYDWSNKANTYYGKLEDGRSPGGIYITVKIGKYYQMANEALQQQRIHSLSGKIISVCHGLYGLTVARRELGVLILERFGPEIDCHFGALSRMEKTVLLNHVLEVHSLGKILCDLDPSSVLESHFCSGDLRLTDLAGIESDHECPRAAHPEHKTFRFRVEDTEKEQGDFPAVCRHILIFAVNMNYWDHGKVDFLDLRFNVDEVPSERVMNRLFPVNWVRVFGPSVQRTLLREWFRYMQKEIQAHGLQNTLDTALNKLDAWEKEHLPRYRRKREWMFPKLKGATPYQHKNGLVKIPYKAEGSSVVPIVSDSDSDSDSADSDTESDSSTSSA
ncbi:hypothetical protein CYLTODRAFT_452061 [Cylindrobasidium torrendii FP15055 ss-10]|uniref:Uncharacterized protein n=1 Tax=Cylindrobasidium torrendii FP15055 ss-10 TaxID=1314674 RepID=A0A0D7BIX0_9AGAR|nr:hypothetical protein CYLTODRAFT_452061 [Cylindrobasidium torrendii FP15055 ss-10]